MLLAIDIGNTNTVLGVFDGEKLHNSWRIKTDARSTADELALTFRGLLADTEITGIAACSTVPAVHARAARHARRATTRTCRPCSSSPACAPASACITDNPKEVGADRIVNTARGASPRGRAGHRRRLRHVDELRLSSARGGSSSAARSPRASRSRSTRWPRGRPSCARSSWSRRAAPIGKNTVEALQSGILYGFAGQVDGLVRRLSAVLAPKDPESVDVIATGGLATLVIDHCETVTRYEPDLTLIGLRLIFERNG